MSRSNPTHTTRRALLASLPVAAATLTPAATAALGGLASEADRAPPHRHSGAKRDDRRADRVPQRQRADIKWRHRSS
jgi:hypothetical protein